MSDFAAGALTAITTVGMTAWVFVLLSGGL